jgi:hemoglobin
MKDIETTGDIQLLVDRFYDRVKQDDKIGFIFHNIIGKDWSHHLPVMYQFWSMVLLNQQDYTGNPVRKHVEIDKRMPLKPEHYERWLSLWNKTVDELFSGNHAEEAKKKAKLMIELISYKVEWARQGKSIQ